MISRAVELSLTAIAFGLIGTFSATRFALSIVMLTGDSSPWARAIAYAAGSTAVFAIVALLGAFGVQVSGLGNAPALLDIVIGAAMIGIAIVLLVRARRRASRPPEPPRHSLIAAAGIGAGASIQSFGRIVILFAGAYRIGTLTDGPITAIGFASLMVAVWQAPVWAPMLVYAFRRDRFEALASRARPTLNRLESGAFSAVMVGAVGLFLIWVGVAE